MIQFLNTMKDTQTSESYDTLAQGHAETSSSRGHERGGTRLILTAQGAGRSHVHQLSLADGTLPLGTAYCATTTVGDRRLALYASQKDGYAC